METEILDLDEQVRIRREKLIAMQNAGNDPFAITKFDKTHNSNDILENYDVLEGKDVAIAGRIILKRVMGKASFVHILDEQGKIQTYISVNDIGENLYDQFKDWDLGDIIGVNGFVFKTKTGEISIHAKTVILLAKALKPLPDKYHGLKDPELRFRERYVDLIVNPEVKQIFILRTKIIKAIREFLDNRGFLEVETPILQTVTGGAEARPFITHHNSLNMPMYLRIANELHLKRLIVGGFEKVYEMGRMFRNEGLSYKHNPEFTNIELYQSYADYNDMMNLTEELFKFVMQKTLGTTKITYEGHEIDFGKPWRRVRMFDIAKDYKDFDENIEPTLIQPTFVTGYPVEISPLAKREKGNPKFTERFELFVGGRELANAYSELNDPIDQRARFEEQMAKRAKGDVEAHMQDDDFLNAMDYAMPPTGGLGIGVDRFIMMLTGVHSIRECLLFPTMKPVAGKKQIAIEAKPIQFTIDKEITNKFGKVTVGVLEVETKPNSDMKVLKTATEKILQETTITETQLAKWQNIFKTMGADADKQSSVAFLTKTFGEKGKLFDIHPIVNLYNAISVKHGLPMGAYDMESLAGGLKLRMANAGEQFTGIGGKVTEPTVQDEVVYSDDKGVICRYWNYKDSDRTKITKTTTKFVIFFDGVDDAERIKTAQDEMINILKDFNCKSYIAN